MNFLVLKITIGQLCQKMDDRTPTGNTFEQEYFSNEQDKTSTQGGEEYPIGFRKCRSVEEYEFLNQIGSGTYGVVCKFL